MKTAMSVARSVKPARLVILLLAVGLVGTILPSAEARPAGYTFTKLATIPGPAPRPEGGEFTFDFEPFGINNRAVTPDDKDIGALRAGHFDALVECLAAEQRHDDDCEILSHKRRVRLSGRALRRPQSIVRR